MLPEALGTDSRANACGSSDCLPVSSADRAASTGSAAFSLPSLPFSLYLVEFGRQMSCDAPLPGQNLISECS